MRRLKEKIKVGLIFGGKSSEHEVSLQSAKNIYKAINKDKYDVTLIRIDKKGEWNLYNQTDFLKNKNNPTLNELNKSNQGIAVVPGLERKQMIRPDNNYVLNQLDVVFPILHGSLGEDGSIQGMLRLANIPFVGSGVLSSALCMDKDMAKKILKIAGLDVAKSITYHKQEKIDKTYHDIIESFGTPFFVKPANQGSSVGVHKIRTEREYLEALEDAFTYDHKVLIEECIVGKEIECAVLGNNKPQASLPGEIIPKSDFYSYESKYIDESGAILEIPAKLTDEKVIEVKEKAIKAFKALECRGIARVDFFIHKSGKIIVNEVNTLPGFTKISMYPKLWEVSGLSYSSLIDKLIELALEQKDFNNI